MVFHDHTACTDPGNIVGGAGGGGPGPSATSFFSTVLFEENYNFPRLQRESNIFRGGGGQTNFTPGGGGGGQSIRNSK